MISIAEDEMIEVIGARSHNLKNISVQIPRNKLVVITGLSGSGKSSLAFDTIYAEGQRRYLESFSSYARQFLGNLERPDVDKISGLSPVISIEQKTVNKYPRSTVGTITEIYDFMRLLFARAGEAFSYNTGEKMVRYTDEQIEVIHQLINATKIPHKPNNKLEEIICDADLDYLGGDEFHPIADKLKLELMEREIVKSDKQWDELQVKFLEAHHYFTDTAIRLRQPNKQKRIEEIKERLKNYE